MNTFIRAHLALLTSLALAACANPFAPASGSVRLVPEDEAASASDAAPSARRPTSADHWVTDENGDLHWVEDAGYAVGMREIDGAHYLFDQQGYLLTGWQHVDDLWYHFADLDYPLPGAASTGWQDIDGTRYHFDTSTGAMDTGWTSIDGAWYHFAPDGSMDSGWIEIGGKRYVMDAGKLVSGWRQEGDDWYWLDPADGAMATGWTYVQGSWYFFDDEGRMVRSTWQDGYYLLETGAMAYDWQKIDDKWYYFDAHGTRLHDRWVGNYYLGSDGAMLTNTRTPDGYRVGADGAWVTTGAGSDIGDPGAERVTVSATTSRTIVSGASNRTVFFEAGKTVYHYDEGCRVLYGARELQSATQAQALADGMTPCAVCAY